MRITMKNISFVLLFTIFLNGIFVAQERSVINGGVDKYEEGDYNGATENFKKSVDNKFENYEGHFNLGDALYKQQKYEDALNSYKNALTLAKNDEQKAQVYHNVGNSLLKTQKFKEAVGAYSESLKLNPNDLDTKYNLSYALKQMQQQQNNDKNKDKNDKNKDDKNKDDKNKDDKKDGDKNKDDKNKDDKNKDDKNKDDKNKDKNDDNQQDKNDDKQNNKDEQQNQKQQPPPEISKEEAQRILNALKDNEKDMQKELRRKKGKVIKVEKDW